MKTTRVAGTPHEPRDALELPPAGGAGGRDRAAAAVLPLLSVVDPRHPPASARRLARPDRMVARRRTSRGATALRRARSCRGPRGDARASVAARPGTTSSAPAQHESRQQTAWRPTRAARVRRTDRAARTGPSGAAPRPTRNTHVRRRGRASREASRRSTGIGALARPCRRSRAARRPPAGPPRAGVAVSSSTRTLAAQRVPRPSSRAVPGARACASSTTSNVHLVASEQRDDVRLPQQVDGDQPARAGARGVDRRLRLHGLAAQRHGVQHERIQVRPRHAAPRPIAARGPPARRRACGLRFACVNLVQQQSGLHGLAHADLVGEQQSPMMAGEEHHRRHVLPRRASSSGRRRWRSRPPRRRVVACVCHNGSAQRASRDAAHRASAWQRHRRTETRSGEAPRHPARDRHVAARRAAHVDDAPCAGATTHVRGQHMRWAGGSSGVVRACSICQFSPCAELALFAIAHGPMARFPEEITRRTGSDAREREQATMPRGAAHEASHEGHERRAEVAARIVANDCRRVDVRARTWCTRARCTPMPRPWTRRRSRRPSACASCR